MLSLMVVALALTQPATLSAAGWQHSIVTGYAAGRREFTLAPGVYRLSDPAGDFYLDFSDLSGVKLNGQGVTLLLSDPSRGGIRFSNCRNLSLAGFTFRHDPMPYTQGKIVSIASDAKSYTVEIAKGYPSGMDDPALFPKQPTGYVFDPQTRQWKRGTLDLSFQNVVRVGPRTFRFDLDRPVQQPASTGDLMAFRGIGRQGILLDRCAGMDVEDVTVQAAGIFGLHEDGGDGGNHYRGFKVTYPPRPAGALEDPLMSNGADAFHSSGTRVGPTLEGCLFEGMPDDGIAIHGMYGQIAEADGRRLVIGTIYGLQAEKGDTYRIYSGQGSLWGSATITQIEALPGYAPARHSSHQGFSTLRAYFAVTLDKAVAAEFDGLVCSEQRVGSGFAVRGNTIRNNRARGILIKASDGVVEGNTIEGSTITGILVAPEGYWMEADFSRNLRIRNNVIRHVGYAMVGSWTYSAGALSVVSDGLEALGHQNIVIEGNTFEDIDGINLMVTNARSVQIAKNRFVGTQMRPTNRGADYRVDPESLIWIARSSGVTIGDNLLERSATASGKRVVLGQDVEGLTSDWTAVHK